MPKETLDLFPFHILNKRLSQSNELQPYSTNLDLHKEYGITQSMGIGQQLLPLP